MSVSPQSPVYPDITQRDLVQQVGHGHRVDTVSEDHRGPPSETGRSGGRRPGSVTGPRRIVRGERGRTGSIPGDGSEDPVVVGIDGSPVSEAALAFGFDAAAARGVGLVAVHAWSPTAIDKALAPLLDWEVAEVEGEALLAERLAGWGQKYPQVPVHRTVVRDRAVRALVDASREAQLVVVGSRGRGNATGLLLGSVSHGVLHGAHCPVAVVRPGTDS